MAATSPGRGEPVTLRDGTAVLVRPLTPEDEPLLLAGFERFGAESRYQRFLGAKAGLTARDLAFLSELDHRDREALGALDPATGEGLGVARYVRHPDDRELAEAAVAVVDAWQGRGLGRVLLERLADRATANGITRFSATLLTSNRTMLHLFERLGKVQVRPDSGSVLEIDVELPVHREQLAEALGAAGAGLVAAWLDLGAWATGQAGGAPNRGEGEPAAPRTRSQPLGHRGGGTQ